MYAGSLQVIKKGIKYNLITPLKDLEIEGKDAKIDANVVGKSYYSNQNISYCIIDMYCMTNFADFLHKSKINYFYNFYISGFDTEAVYMQGEAKRKVLRGDEEAYKNLKYSQDRCIDFAQSVSITTNVLIVMIIYISSNC